MKPTRKSTKEVLRDLSQLSNAAIHSTTALVGSVEKAATKDDQKREEKGSQQLRRKRGLQPVPSSESTDAIPLTTWDVLHWLAHALSLSRQGAGRGLAEHWGSLKYSQAMDPASDAYIEVSEEGKGISRRYKQLQSEELGQGFGLALAKHVLTQRHPDRCVSIVSADVVLRAGWPKRSSGYPYQPHFFAEVWKPGEPSIVVPVATKGNHSHRGRYSSIQLASCSAHVEAMHVGPWDQTPCLIFSTELPAEGPVTIYALHAQGKDGWLDSFPKGSLHSLDRVANNENFLPGIQPTTKGGETPAFEPGFHVPPRNYAWFQHVLARTVTAGVTAFAGDGDTTAHYLTSRQGSQRYSTGFAHAAIGSVQDAEHKLLDISFTGTDHVFRLNNKRVEAFSGVASDLFSLLSPRVADGKLAPGRVEQYREEVYARRKSWPEQAWDEKWKGPVSIHEDGTVLAMRLLPG